MWAPHTQKNNCHKSTPLQQKILFPATSAFNTTHQYLFFSPRIAAKNFCYPHVLWRNSLNLFLHLYPYVLCVLKTIKDAMRNNSKTLPLRFQKQIKMHIIAPVIFLYSQKLPIKGA